MWMFLLERRVTHGRKMNKRIPYLCASQLFRAKSGAMPRDPVCGMVLDERTARFKINHEGETYYFCSVKCKKRFKRNPQRSLR